MAALHLTISGRVQGVGFRWSMCAEALAHGARGWVRNRGDGRVEALVEGAPEVVAAMLRWAQQGPRMARVDRVDSRPATAGEAALVGAGFEPLADA